MTTKEIIAGMLQENTGSYFLDLGGAYGRHWQRNQEVDFASKPAVEVDCNWSNEGDRIDFTINLYHFLTTNLTSDDVTDEFNSRFSVMDDWDVLVSGLSGDAIYWLARRFNLRASELSNGWHNTYNFGESNLSQVIRYKYVANDYILLQVHNGCDARGVPTDAKLFKLQGDGLCEGVYGSVTYPDGRKVDVDSMHNGYSLTTEAGEEVLYETGMIINLYQLEP